MFLFSGEMSVVLSRLLWKMRSGHVEKLMVTCKYIDGNDQGGLVCLYMYMEIVLPYMVLGVKIGPVQSE